MVAETEAATGACNNQPTDGSSSSSNCDRNGICGSSSSDGGSCGSGSGNSGNGGNGGSADGGSGH